MAGGLRRFARGGKQLPMSQSTDSNPGESINKQLSTADNDSAEAEAASDPWMQFNQPMDTDFLTAEFDVGVGRNADLSSEEIHDFDFASMAPAADLNMDYESTHPKDSQIIFERSAKSAEKGGSKPIASDSNTDSIIPAAPPAASSTANLEGGEATHTTILAGVSADSKGLWPSHESERNNPAQVAAPAAMQRESGILKLPSNSKESDSLSMVDSRTDPEANQDAGRVIPQGAKCSSLHQRASGTRVHFLMNGQSGSDCDSKGGIFLTPKGQVDDRVARATQTKKTPDSKYWSNSNSQDRSVNLNAKDSFSGLIPGRHGNALDDSATRVTVATVSPVFDVTPRASRVHVSSKSGEEDQMNPLLKPSHGDAFTITPDSKYIMAEGSSEDCKESHGSDCQTSFEELHSKFLKDLLEVEDMQNKNSSRLLELNVLFSMAYAESLRDQASFRDILEQAHEVEDALDDIIASYNEFLGV